jgi:hypothetical protein
MMTKINFEQFLEATDTSRQVFTQNIHNYLLNNDCKVTFQEKKSGLLASYKHTKSKKAIVNLLFRKKGMFIRIYGENAYQYLDFLNTLPEEMVQSIADATVCKRLVYNECSPKCSGYDVTIGGERFQKCRYSGFLFLITNESIPFIKSFVENETMERNEQFIKI